MKLFVMSIRKSIREQYLKFLDREPTLDDLDFYFNEIQNNKINLEQLALVLKNSDESIKIQKKPNSTQRELATELGFSLGKLNYCLKALQENLKRRNLNI